MYFTIFMILAASGMVLLLLLGMAVMAGEKFDQSPDSHGTTSGRMEND